MMRGKTVVVLLLNLLVATCFLSGNSKRGINSNLFLPKFIFRRTGVVDELVPSVKH